jgi:hypothetical protein
VAIGTILHDSLPDKLVVVVIIMTISTVIVFQWVCNIVFMTGSAGHRLMFTLQFKVGSGMIEIADTFYDVKGYFRMALTAFLPEFTLMDIGVTVGAIVMGDSRKFLENSFIFFGNRVALDARNRFMCSRQGIVCIGMIEFHRRLERFNSMTIGTGGPEGFLMVIGMAGQT